MYVFDIPSIKQQYGSVYKNDIHLVPEIQFGYLRRSFCIGILHSFSAFILLLTLFIDDIFN